MWTGTIFDLQNNLLRNIIENGSIILQPQIFIIRVDILSWPWALLMSKTRMVFKISWSSRPTAEFVASHKQFVSVGIELSFSIGVHC